MSVVARLEECPVSAEALAALGDIGPCELVAGRIVPMTPTSDAHGACEGNVYQALRAFVRERGLGKVRVGEVGVLTGRNPDTVRAADVLFISNERYARRDVTSPFLDVAPDLVVEVMSPSNSWSEVVQKLREYFAIGVRLVWVVDPQLEIVHAYRSTTDVRELGPGEVLPGDDVLPGLAIPVGSLFED
jgi:Uma2 family endonuclease